MSHRVLGRCLALWLMTAVFSLIGCSRMDSTFGGEEQPGKELFDLHCAPCHEAVNPDLKKPPPKLEGLFQAKTLPSGAPATDEQVRETIVLGLHTMPPFDHRLSSEDLDDLLKYLHTLK
jgi:mono/diheme cytochrome c family protein